jgi:Na+-translocating ferredoxin:NAD+ oxidoreductase RnfD subunit
MQASVLELRKFFRTPKGLLLPILAVLVLIAVPGQGVSETAPGLIAAVVIAGVLDAVILRSRRGHWNFPSGAALTALIAGMVLRAQEHWYVPVGASVIGVLSKYVLRSRACNIFNPAALGVIAAYHIFHAGNSWWGALPESSPVLQLVMVAGGYFIADRVNKVPLVLVFLGCHFFLFSGAAFLADPQHVMEIFRAPDLQAALYFALIILTDPPTSPIKYRDQVKFGILVAVVSFVVFETTGVVYFLLAGVLAGNVRESWRRLSAKTGGKFPASLPAYFREISPLKSKTPSQKQKQTPIPA